MVTLSKISAWARLRGKPSSHDEQRRAPQEECRQPTKIRNDHGEQGDDDQKERADKQQSALNSFDEISGGKKKIKIATKII
jgi:hypothetical protein